MNRTAAIKSRPHLKRRVLPNGRSAASLPYASILPSIPTSAAFRRLSGIAVRLWLLLQADYNPGHDTILPRDRAMRELEASPHCIGAGFAELIAAKIILKVQDGCRPGTMGSQSAGRATVYDLPDRRGLTGEWKVGGDPSFAGRWRIDVPLLRQAATDLTGPEAKLWAYLHARDRRADGGPASNAPLQLSPTDVAKALDLSRATVKRAMAGLVSREILRCERPAAGRSPATYCLTEAQTRGASARRAKPK